MKFLLGVLFLSIFLVSCAADRQPADTGSARSFSIKIDSFSGPSDLGQSCKRDSDCGFSEKCASGRCYGI